MSERKNTDAEWVSWKAFDERVAVIQSQLQAITYSVQTLEKGVTKAQENLDKYNEILFNPKDGLILKMDKRISREENYTRFFIGFAGAVVSFIVFAAANFIH